MVRRKIAVFLFCIALFGSAVACVVKRNGGSDVGVAVPGHGTAGAVERSIVASEGGLFDHLESRVADAERDIAARQREVVELIRALENSHCSGCACFVGSGINDGTKTSRLLN